MIGINAVVMDDVQVGEGCIVGALAFLKAQSKWEPRSIVAGNPAKVIGQVSDAMHRHKVEGNGLYQSLPADYAAHLIECPPLRKAPLNRIEDFQKFETWQKRRSTE